MPKKITTNTELVRDLMEYSPQGAISQMIIIEAIRRYAEACAKADPAKFDNPMIRGTSWVACAKDIVTRMDAFYNRHNAPAKAAPAELPDWVVNVIEVETLDDGAQKGFTKPWLCQWPDGSIEEFDTEDEACARQVEIGREA